MSFQQIFSLGFRECDGSSLNEEQVRAIENGMVVIKPKSGNRIKIFLMHDGKRFSLICDEVEESKYLRKLNHPQIYRQHLERILTE